MKFKLLPLIAALSLLAGPVAQAQEEESLIKAAPNGLDRIPGAAFTEQVAADRLPRDIVVANPDGDVTVTEFFDYYCHVCQRIGAEVLEIARQDGNIRLVLREFPILNGQDSISMARFALAAHKQGLYLQAHEAFMERHGRINVESAAAILEGLGADMDQLWEDVNDRDVLELLQFNVQLGVGADLRATPSFMIEGVPFEGYMGRENLLSVVAQIRELKAEEAAANGS